MKTHKGTKCSKEFSRRLKTGIQYLPADSIQISWQSLSRSHCLNSRIELLKADLLFRHFQQFFSIRTVKAGSVRYAESLVLLQLILWFIMERQVFQCECYLRENGKDIGSIYENCKMAFIRIKTILCLEWSLFVDLADEEYLRFLSQRKRLRGNQN